MVAESEEMPYNDFAKQLLRKHESRRLKVYDDADGLPIVPGKLVKGHPTIGWGRCLDTKGINVYEADDLFENDFIEAEATIVDIFGIPILSESKERLGALISMAYNLGDRGFRGFVKMINAIRRRSWEEVASQAKDSKWYTQVGIRGREIVKLLKEGK